MINNKKLENSKKIDIFINMIRDTYFKHFDISCDTTANVHFSYASDEDFHIIFPMLDNIDYTLSDVINKCNIININSNIITNSIKHTKVLYVYSNMDTLNIGLDKIDMFVQSYNRSIRGINKFNL